MAALATPLQTERNPVVSPQNPVILVGLVVIVALGLLIQHTASTRLALLFVIGMALGVVLYRSLFGFTSAFRVLLADGRSAGFRAQLIMLGAACLLFFPALAEHAFISGAKGAVVEAALRVEPGVEAGAFGMSRSAASSRS